MQDWLILIDRCQPDFNFCTAGVGSLVLDAGKPEGKQARMNFFVWAGVGN